ISALSVQIDVEVSKHGTEAVGVSYYNLPSGHLQTQSVGIGFVPLHRACKDTVSMLADKLSHTDAVARAQHRDSGGLRLKHADEKPSPHTMHSEERKWVGVVGHRNRYSSLKDLMSHRRTWPRAPIGGDGAIISFLHGQIPDECRTCCSNLYDHRECDTLCS